VNNTYVIIYNIENRNTFNLKSHNIKVIPTITNTVHTYKFENKCTIDDPKKLFYVNKSNLIIRKKAIIR